MFLSFLFLLDPTSRIRDGRKSGFGINHERGFLLRLFLGCEL
jgi:hypothetical protein